MINVTKPYLPPREEFDQLVDGIWQRNWLTNNGPLVNALELKLKEYLKLSNVFYLNNGTIALQLAIKALQLKGDIITTPFSYVATTSSIVWEGCRPVFVDIHPGSLNIDPSKIEVAITENTSAIIATHVYGNPCEIDRIEEIAYKYNLRVIYDAAHAFGTQYKDQSIYSYGDISTASFHSTKLFHTIEGGAIFATKEDLINRLSYMRNFGHIGDDYKYVGVNAKNSEFHAAMGLANLKHIESMLIQRKTLSLHYDECLNSFPHVRPEINPNCKYNYAYYPIILDEERLVLEVLAVLQANKVYPRRYFYPSLNSLPYVSTQSMPVSESISKRVLCLPLFHDLTFQEIDWLTSLIKKA